MVETVTERFQAMGINWIHNLYTPPPLPPGLAAAAAAAAMRRHMISGGAYGSSSEGSHSHPGCQSGYMDIPAVIN